MCSAPADKSINATYRDAMQHAHNPTACSGPSAANGALRVTFDENTGPPPELAPVEPPSNTTVALYDAPVNHGSCWLLERRVDGTNSGIRTLCNLSPTFSVDQDSWELPSNLLLRPTCVTPEF